MEGVDAEERRDKRRQEEGCEKLKLRKKKFCLRRFNFCPPYILVLDPPLYNDISVFAAEARAMLAGLECLSTGGLKKGRS